MTDQEQSALELAALRRVIASGARALQLDVILDRCLEQAIEVARADGGTIYLRDDKRGSYRLAAARNLPPQMTPPTVTIDERLRGDHQLHELAALDRVEPLAPPARAAGFSHGLVFVLVVEERRVGFLGLMFNSKPALTASTTQTLEAIAAFEAIALDSARLHQQAELRAHVAHALNDCAERLLDVEADVPALILESACKIARGDGALLSRMFERDGVQYSRIVHAIGDDERLIGVELPTSAPYLRESLAQRAPTVIEDIGTLDPESVIGRTAREQGTRAFILATMWQRDRPLGQLFVKSKQPRVYADAEVEAIRLLSSMAAQALERARRRAEERQEQERIAAILEHLPIVIAVIDRTGRPVHVNAAGRAFAERLGAENLDWREMLRSLQVYDRDGKPVAPDDSGVARAFAGATTSHERTLVTMRGERLHALSISVPLRGRDGSVEAVLTSFQDVTALRELADAKDRFLSIASHELRSPITSLRATTSLLQLDPAAVSDEARRATLLARIQRQVDRLSTLVERLLDTTRLNAGEVPLDYADADLAALCRDAVEQARLTDPEHRYVVEAREPIAGRWDPARIEQVLTNLLSNACRYSPVGSDIVVRARRDGDARAAVDVVDDGPGIAPDQLPKLFTPFYRGSAAARHKSGLGLGLYITSEIVRRHGGSLRVSSPPGQGATFTVELPLAPH